MKPKPNNDWLAALEKCCGATTETPGPEWKTKRQLEVELDRGHTAVDRLVKLMTENGAIERKVFMLRTGSARRPVPHYRLK